MLMRLSCSPRHRRVRKNRTRPVFAGFYDFLTGLRCRRERVCSSNLGAIYMRKRTEETKLIAKLNYRLQQAHKISSAALTCATEECPRRTLVLLEEVEDIVRDAGNLVSAAMILKYPATEAEISSEGCGNEK